MFHLNDMLPSAWIYLYEKDETNPKMISDYVERVNKSIIKNLGKHIFQNRKPTRFSFELKHLKRSIENA